MEDDGLAVSVSSHSFAFQHCVTALGKNFHVQCFVCAECGVEFGEEGFHEKVHYYRIATLMSIDDS